MKPRNLRIAITAHFTRADLATFSDFKSLKKSFDHVRGTFASVKRPTIREIRMPNGARVKATLTLFDTRLLAPAGAGKLRDLGNLIGLPKLEVPDVVNEKGKTVPGIESMDLVHAHHPVEFAAYAIRDAEVSVTYLRRVVEFAQSWGLTKMPPTVASIATMRLRNDASHLLPGILGRDLTRQGRSHPIAEARAIQSLAADAYHGGRNEAFVHGIFTATPERPFIDYDLKGCYTTAMAGFRTLDWAAIEHTTDLSRLAVLEDPTVASIDFEFPDSTRFPCLPVNTGDGGLVYPLSGSTTATGPELLLAVNLDARITVRAGARVPWEEPDMDRAERPFRDFAQLVNRERAAHAKGSVFELMAKEFGNSLYGKLGQGVGEMKSIPDNIRLFDTRDGSRHALPPSVITCPMLAAMTSGLPRAVLSEILSRLPAHVIVLSATTDGWISNATEDEIRVATQGPICRWFARLRASVDPKGSPDILEIKHQALSMLVARTRHGMTIEPFAGSEYFIASAGHRLNSREFDYDKGDKAAEAKALAAECCRICPASARPHLRHDGRRHQFHFHVEAVGGQFRPADGASQREGCTLLRFQAAPGGSGRFRRPHPIPDRAVADAGRMLESSQRLRQLEESHSLRAQDIGRLDRVRGMAADAPPQILCDPNPVRERRSDGVGERAGGFPHPKRQGPAA